MDVDQNNRTPVEIQLFYCKFWKEILNPGAWFLRIGEYIVTFLGSLGLRWVTAIN